MAKQILKFPKNFLWGAAFSAYQTEGNNSNSDWWAWERSVKRQQELKSHSHPAEQYFSGPATDFYSRYDEDFTLAQHLNHNAVRFGVEWSRIEPKEGEFDEQAILHYEKILQSAKYHGLKVFLTLHHFSLPRWFAEKGGFEKTENIQYFIRFCQKIIPFLDPYVDFWITFNEPEVYSTYCFLLGVFPPQKKSLWATYKVIGNVILAHNQLVPKLRLLSKKPVSLAYHLSDLQPAGLFGSLARWLAHYIADEYIIRRTIRNCDFIGVNYYFHHHVSLRGVRHSSHSHHVSTDMDWGVHPEGLERVLLNVKKFNKPIYITENGLADAQDSKREKYIKDHLYFVHRAIEQGADVRGYLYWSLTDNFEWQHGFWPRFGLIEIDREDLLRRKVRYSAIKYAEVCRDNGFTYDDSKP